MECIKWTMGNVFKKGEIVMSNEAVFLAVFSFIKYKVYSFSHCAAEIEHLFFLNPFKIDTDLDNTNIIICFLSLHLASLLSGIRIIV